MRTRTATGSGEKQLGSDKETFIYFNTFISYIISI